MPLARPPRPRQDGVVGGAAGGFDYERRGAEVVITHHGRRAGRLRGHAAQRFLAEVEADPQGVMARVTGNYKHGNERVAKQHPRHRSR